MGPCTLRREKRETKKGWEPFHCGKSQRPRLTLSLSLESGLLKEEEGEVELLSALNYLQRHFLLNVGKTAKRGQTFLPLSLSPSVSLKKHTPWAVGHYEFPGGIERHAGGQ